MSMDMSMELTGGCLCGAVRYQCAAAVVLSGNCHCRDCQKASGSAYAPTLFVPRIALTVTGEVRWFEKLADSGLVVGRGFCPHCGSSLFGRTAAMPDLTAIRAGSLDDPSSYHPQVDIYTSRAAPWDFMDPQIPRFPEMPPRAAGT